MDQKITVGYKSSNQLEHKAEWEHTGTLERQFSILGIRGPIIDTSASASARLIVSPLRNHFLTFSFPNNCSGKLDFYEKIK